MSYGPPPSSYDPATQAQQALEDATVYAQDAINYDRDKKYPSALFFYQEAVSSLLRASSLDPSLKDTQTKAKGYLDRAEIIKSLMSSSKEVKGPPQASSEHQKTISKLEFTLESAQQLEQQGKLNRSLSLFQQAGEAAITAARAATGHPEEKKLLGKLAGAALEGAEKVKGTLKERKATSQNSSEGGLKVDHLASFRGEHTRHDGPTQRVAPNKLLSYLDTDTTPYQGLKPKSDSLSEVERLPPNKLLSYLDADTEPTRVDSNPSDPSPHPPGPESGPRRDTSRSGRLSSQEVSVLKATSNINGRVYMPWHDADLSELADYRQFADSFNDPDGLPALAAKQAAMLHGWFRPGDICDEPKMVYAMSSASIKQTIVSDCSFVASLGVCAEYEKRFKKRLVTRCIYPQNKKGQPIINPYGKYFVCLNLNGCRRRVLIDDRLPIAATGELLSSYSINRDEFWVSLLEKAYIKVMGGYDFPGSSSNIDLHALTGWIPERLTLKPHLPEQLKPEQVFKTMLDSLHKGQALMTAATGKLSEGEADRAGLVQTHAYAVLDVKEAFGQKLVQLKNPWSHKRWKGNFAADDKTNWTPDLKRVLGFDQLKAMQVDNGVFWIDLKSFQHFFDVVYLNWNPDMFHYKRHLHDNWSPEQAGPIKDTYAVEKNPQYGMEVRARDAGQAWVLLSRHITDKKDFANNQKFITLHIKKSDGKRVYYPGEYLHEGIKINAPHYLAKISFGKGTSHYTLIVAQLEALSKISYTVRVFSSAEVSLGPVPNPYRNSRCVTDEWTADSAGGCGNNTSFIKNPVYRLEIQDAAAAGAAEVLIKLEGPRKFSVGFQVTPEVKTAALPQINSGAYRPGLAVLETSLPSGNYSLIPSTFNPGERAPFFFTVGCSHIFKFNRVK